MQQNRKSKTKVASALQVLQMHIATFCQFKTESMRKRIIAFIIFITAIKSFRVWASLFEYLQNLRDEISDLQVKIALRYYY